MPGKLTKYLPSLTDAQRLELFGSITSVMTSPRGDPVREGVIRGTYPHSQSSPSITHPFLAGVAYDDVRKTMTIVATVIAIVPLLLAFLMPNWYLGDSQNAVEKVDLGGSSLHDEEKDTKGH